MALEPIMLTAVTRAQAQATQFGGTCVKGAEALSDAGSRPARRNIGAVIFNDGDVIEIPQLPSVNAETADQWVKKPLSKGGDPVTSVLVKCTSKSGAVTVKEFFLGTLFKSQQNNDTGEFMETKGSAREACEGKDTEASQWAAIAGKKLRFSNPVQFKTLRRDFSGTRPDRIASSAVWTINIEG